MGRGGNEDLNSLIAGGEIPLLDADRITDHEGDAAPEKASDVSFGNSDDERAIKRIAERLKKTAAGRGLSPDELEDKAIDLYNRSCEHISSGRASSEQIARAAELFGEDPEKLSERLRSERAPEDLAGSDEPSGASGLLRALRG